MAIVHVNCNWFAAAKLTPVPHVAVHLGLRVLDSGLAPCPVCGAALRGRADTRGPVGLTDNLLGWRCHQCCEGGDSIDLAAHRLLGHSFSIATTAERARVEAWFGGLPAALPEALPRRLAQSARPEAPSRGDRRHVARPPAAAPVQKGLVRAQKPLPSVEEVWALWNACRPVTKDPVVVTWLRSRGLDPTAVASSDMARALPLEVSVPAWATFSSGRSWSNSSWRLIMPVFDARGGLASVRARSVWGEPKCKSIAPRGVRAGGLVLTSPEGQRLLLGHSAAREILICEGEPDLLTWALYGHGFNGPAAIFGIVAGGWPTDLADQFPDGSVVTVATDADQKGDEYAAQIAAGVAERARAGRLWVRRWRYEPDANAMLQRGVLPSVLAAVNWSAVGEIPIGVP